MKQVVIAVIGALLVFVGVFMYYISQRQPPAGAVESLVFEYYRMYFAYGVLVAIAVLLVLAAALYFLAGSNGASQNPAGKEIFDSFIKILPPIATLVIGYYFGTTQVNKPTAEKNEKQIADIRNDKAESNRTTVNLPSGPEKKQQ